MNPNDLPPNIVREAKTLMINYSVFLLAWRTIDGKEHEELIGSGTLVSCGTSFGIITANHVITSPSLYCNTDKIGLVTREASHRVIFQKNLLTEISVGKPLPNTNKPDLAFIRLPQGGIGSLKAHKSFLNLDTWHNKIDKIRMPRETGLWFLFGSPISSRGIKEQIESSRTKRIYPGVAALGGPPDFFEEDEYDYLLIEVDMPNATDKEKDFRGVSGGGVWRVILIDKGSGEISVGPHVFCGVAFYQTEIDNKRNLKIICHGQRSIYDKLYSVISSM